MNCCFVVVILLLCCRFLSYSCMKHYFSFNRNLQFCKGIMRSLSWHFQAIGWKLYCALRSFLRHYKYSGSMRCCIEFNFLSCYLEPFACNIEHEKMKRFKKKISVFVRFSFLKNYILPCIFYLLCPFSFNHIN